jgi:DNA-binding response OmpR family regulator
MAATVLLVEDERKLRELVRSYLERAGFTVLSTGSGAEAITLASSASPDLVVLDLGLPDVPGDTVAREVQAVAAVPVLILTARSSEEDRIRGLELGADDYVTKPFSPRELVLRVQAILRRGGPTTGDHRAVSYGGGVMIIDEPRRQVMVRGSAADLTPTEWGVLVALATVPGRVYSRFELINRVRGYEFEGYERTIDSHVKNLRRKIEEDPGNPQIVQTVLGSGYRLGLARDDLVMDGMPGFLTTGLSSISTGEAAVSLADTQFRYLAHGERYQFEPAALAGAGHGRPGTARAR